MKVSGFTFVRNGSSLGYPFVESIRSLLPLCDEIIVNVPESTDDTLAQVRAIGDPRIEVMETDWDEKFGIGDLALKRHTDLALERCSGDWCVYIQGDEVLHEKTIPSMRSAMEQNLDQPGVQGLLVDYTHFYGSYWTYACSFGWYQQEVRVVRRNSSIRAWGGAQGFRTTSGEKLHVRHSGGHYFHYGHALKPEVVLRKYRNLAHVYGNGTSDVRASRPAEQVYENDQKVKPFTGEHPAVMHDTVAAADWTYTSTNPLLRFRKKVFWNDVAYLVKQCTGLEFGVRRNYRLLRS